MALCLDNLIHKTTVLPRMLGDSVAQKLLPIASERDLRALSRKSANSEICPVPEAKFDIRPGHSYILLVTLGGGEYWGFNENSDKYLERSGVELCVPSPCEGCTGKLKLGKGLAETHSTFRKYGAVYRNHKTEVADSVPRSGEIVWERWRPDMHWGELIVELPHRKWETELSDYEKGTPLMWSQGSGVPADYCSICGYEFTRKSKKRCPHILLHKLQFTDRGSQVCILCSDATFYDISYVGNNPAAKLAWGLMKVAESGMDPEEAGTWKPIVPIFSRRREFTLLNGMRMRPPEPVLSRLLAEEEAIMPGEAEAFRHSCAAHPKEELEFIDTCRATEPAHLLDGLSRLKIVLTPTQWWRIFAPSTGEPSGVSGFGGALGSIYRRIAGETDGDFLEDAGWLPSGCPDVSLLNRLSPFAGTFSPKPDIRLTVVVKKASSQAKPADIAAADLYLAREYAKYQTACLTTFADPANARWCALSNAACV